MLAVLAALALNGDPFPAGVDAMSLDELLVEDTRLELRRSVTPPAVMVGFGAGVALASFAAFGISTYEAAELARVPSMCFEFCFGGPTFNSGIVQVFSLIHGILAAGTLVGGMLWLPSRVTARDVAELDRGQVRARITELQGQGVRYDRVAVALKQLEIIDEAYPSRALAGQLIAGGVLLLIAGSFSVAFFRGDRSSISAGIGELSVGAAMLSVGAWDLHTRLKEREELDARRESLRAEVASGGGVAPPLYPKAPAEPGI